MRQLSKESEEQDAFGNSKVDPSQHIPEISKDILKALVVDNKTGIEDR